MGYNTSVRHDEAIKTAEYVESHLSVDGSVGLTSQDVVTLVVAYRHAMSVDFLESADFMDRFTEINVQRCKLWHQGFPNDVFWNLADWSNAVCGEVGELANVVKKIRRHDSPDTKKGADDPSREELLLKMADEIGDVYAYLDLLVVKAGIDIKAAITRKFNAVSVREGWPELQIETKE